MKSKAREGLDLLLAEYPDAMIVEYDSQPRREYAEGLGVSSAGVWVCVDLNVGIQAVMKFAILKTTGNVYRVHGDLLGGEVEDDPFLVVTPL